MIQQSEPGTPQQPIAIIGSACRFAGGATCPGKLWELLQNPRDVRKVIPDSRFNAAGFYNANGAYHGHSNVISSYLLEEDISTFDAAFFGVKSNEANAMDPQQRLLMEVVYEAIEAAGLRIESLRSSDTGVFVGAMSADYEAIQLRDLDDIPTYFATGSARSILSNRVSYFFDWHGPSVTIDTACSSSLVALHLAINALRSGESRLAVVCGSNLILGPEAFIMESKLNMLSPDGVGRMWDKSANGYARGEGVATIVLKTVASAIGDGDHIESVLRETAINQDGKTPGITMPSATAQRDLIERTYSKAGLDLSLGTDRPQIFEAHGTGTPAGDPIEAEAIHSAFFGGENLKDENLNHLYVGSIKTILGHTEGTAGIAAVLKASLAIQHRRIPPNLHFKDLNPAVAPFYENLEIPKLCQPWPDVIGAPRRASINSFGFGGTNAHAILESYDDSAPRKTLDATPSAEESKRLFIPFVFSAASEISLKTNICAFAKYLRSARPAADDGRKIAFTLCERRSVFAYRAAITSRSFEELQLALEVRLEDQSTNAGTGAQDLTNRYKDAPTIFGIFTGQGAQYARMGASLIEESPLAGRIIDTLELYLSQLPEADRPRWSLKSELLASSSRVHTAAISQPLCTAVQIMLVDLLKIAKITFDVVIGHSSGEIAAAYAAGYLTARNAIVVAYYRGLHCKKAASPNGEKRGAMLAAGISLENAEELCQDEWFLGRLCVAACNSPSSVTISGDEDAIEQLSVILDDEKKFNRRLRVDQAYHSPHMLPCSNPYMESLRSANVKFRNPPAASGCHWYSSVNEGRHMLPNERLESTYWIENQTRTVLFSQAVGAALMENGTPDVILEIGAHPVLRTAVTHTLKQSVPYHGCLSRDLDATSAMSTCLGNLWCHLGNKFVDLNTYETEVSGQQMSSCMLVKNLPPYQWDHSTQYWHESRTSQRFRLRDSSNPLLGSQSPDSTPYHRRWKNILKRSEMTWLEGHQVQGQVVFPAAGYVSTALETARLLAAGKDIRLIELCDFQFRQAIAFDEDRSAIEVLIEVSDISTDRSSTLTSRFSYAAALGGHTSDMSLVADGKMRIMLDTPSAETLPRRAPPTPHLIEVTSHRLYSFMESLGYNFKGSFRSLCNLKRKLGRATCNLTSAHSDASERATFFLHPAEIDAAFQSIMLAYSYPDDDKLRTLHLPASVASIRINPALCTSSQLEDKILSVDSELEPATPGSGFSGDVDLYISENDNAALQVQGLKFVPFSGAVEELRNVFYKMDWVAAAPDGTSAADGIPVTQQDTNLLWVLSRIASFFLRKFDVEVPKESTARVDPPLCHYLNYASHMTDLLRNGTHRYAKLEWLNDSVDDVMSNITESGFSDNADVKLMLLVGEVMPQVFMGETTMIEHMRTSGLLDEYYVHGFGTMQSSLWLSQAVKQITERSPHLHVLEIGAGTGGATKNIIQLIDEDFDSYTFTDISSSFFENAADLFAQWTHRMFFKVYDAERDPVIQGFKEASYDVVVASLVIHATAKLENTLRNLRKLLRPGGYLVVAEGTSDGPLQSGDGFIFGALPGWWLGVEEGRTISPFVNVQQWDHLLRSTGFSGIDTLAPPQFLDTYGLVLFTSQAVDQRISFLRNPLSRIKSLSFGSKIAQVFIIGGTSQYTTNLASKIKAIFTEIAVATVLYPTLEDTDFASLDEKSIIISLVELDTPTFRNMTYERWNGLKQIFGAGKIVLWISVGRLADMPWSNMPVGFGRTAANETPGLHAQFLDFATADTVDARTISENLLRLHVSVQTADDSGSVLWTAEPEIVVDLNGRHLVPRLKRIGVANDRYNSLRHQLTKDTRLDSEKVELLHNSSNRFRVIKIPQSETAWTDRLERLRVETSLTVLAALKTTIGHQFVTSCVDAKGRRYLALVPRTFSVFDIAKDSAVPYNLEDTGLSEPDFLAAVAACLISSVIMERVYPGQTIALHNVPPLIARAVEARIRGKKIEVFCTTDNFEDTARPASCTRLHPFMSRAELSRKLPSNLTCFVGLSSVSQSQTENTILSLLSPHCRRFSAKKLFSFDAPDTSTAPPSIHFNTLEEAIQMVVASDMLKMPASREQIALGSLVNGDLPENPLTIVDWKAQQSIPVQIRRLDAECLFKSDKSYWLCGMSGALGISVCDWMINRGVKHLIITSRNPKIEQAWIQGNIRNGVDVRIMSCDVTNEEALRAVHKRIVQTMPEIAGALNGAMVLRDSSISNMEYDQVMEVIRPKVLGSIHLDRIFYDVNLDWFILVSSINCVIGNVGQANYAAANTFMCSLAANRRKRGLNAVAVNGGAIIGAGYITRETDRALDITVQRMALMHLSEDDFHQIIAEATEASRLESSISVSEITTGLLDISLDSPYIPKWYSNPKFARFLVHKVASNEVKVDSSVTASVQDQLASCHTQEELSLLIQKTFVAQLRKILQIPSAVSDLEILSKRGSELGLDSLVSVDIRSWFLKNLRVSIPLLKLMGNNSMMSIIQGSMRDIPSDIVPGMAVLQGQDNRESTEAILEGMPAELEASPELSSSIVLDWDVESALPKTFSRTPTWTVSEPAVPPRVIVLTGVTGLLGRHILQSLLDTAATQRIHCLAVRNLEYRMQNKELMLDNRVQYYEGDLSQPFFGLPESEINLIFAQIDAVIHNGADTSHIKNYTELRASNVGSTISLTGLCISRQIPLHYISSAGVAIYSGQDPFPEISVAGPGAILPAADGSFGYGCSKWTSERLLERAYEQYSLPICIYRPSTILREGFDANTPRAELDWVNALLRYVRKLKIAPKLQHNHGFLDLVSIESCCTKLLDNLHYTDPERAVRYVHAVGDSVIPMDCMQNMDADEGLIYDVLPLSQWIDKAVDAGLHPAVGSLIKAMDLEDGPVYPRLSKEPESLDKR